MTTYARITGGIVAEIIEIPPGTPTLAERFHPDIVAASVALTEDQIGVVKVGDTYTDGSFSPAPLPELPPEPEPEPATGTITYKADVWRRCTEAEAEMLRDLIAAAPARQQGLWNDSIYLDAADPDFDFVRQAAVSAFGEARADELLAPSA